MGISRCAQTGNDHSLNSKTLSKGFGIENDGGIRYEIGRCRLYSLLIPVKIISFTPEAFKASVRLHGKNWSQLILVVWLNTYTAKPVCWNGWISDSYCSLKPLCSGMGEVVPARTSLTLLPPSPRTVLS